MLFWLEMSAVFVCAVTGALEAGWRQMDLFGAAVVSLVAAVGGGTLRDLLLGRLPVFWIAAPENLYVVAFAVLVTFLLSRRTPISGSAFLIPDALGLSAQIWPPRAPYCPRRKSSSSPPSTGGATRCFFSLAA